MSRITGALVDWIGQYPGDAVDPTVHAVLLDIVAGALEQPFMSHLTKELVRIENSLESAIDVDASWSLDPNKDSSSVKRSSSSSQLVLEQEGVYDLDPSVAPSEKSIALRKTATVGTNATTATSGTTGSASDPTSSVPSLGTMGSDDVPASTLKRAAAAGVPALTPTPMMRNPSLVGMGLGEDFGNSKWAHAFGVVVNADARVFAVDLTRMQWERFKTLRVSEDSCMGIVYTCSHADGQPRDVLRHDLGKEEQDPVAKAILFFNHLSRW